MSSKVLSDKYDSLVAFLRHRLPVATRVKIVLPETDEEFEQETGVKSQGVLGTALQGDTLYFSPLHQSLMDVFDGTVTADNRDEVLAIKLAVHEMVHLLKDEPGWDNKAQADIGEAVTEAFSLRFMARAVPFEGQWQDYLASLDATALYRDDVLRLLDRLQDQDPEILGILVASEGEELVQEIKDFDQAQPGDMNWLWRDLGGYTMATMKGNINDIAALLGTISDIGRRPGRGTISDIGQIQDIAALLGSIMDIGRRPGLGTISDIGQIQDIAALLGTISDIGLALRLLGVNWDDVGSIMDIGRRPGLGTISDIGARPRLFGKRAQDDVLGFLQVLDLLVKRSVDAALAKSQTDQSSIDADTPATPVEDDQTPSLWVQLAQWLAQQGTQPTTG